MKDEEMLNFIAKNAEMGITGIDAVFESSSGEQFKSELEAQKKEYNNILNGAKKMLSEKDAELQHPSSMAKMSAEMMSKMKTMTDKSDSKIAEMMLEGSAMGVAKIIKRNREYDSCNTCDNSVSQLAQKLLKTEENNIENMKQYL